MSRCFPFPPPGYEKKTIADDPDLLKKEKRKEKKHRKDKKDKEKKDGKEKREKDRSEGKHKEKKDKHRDKKKDKEKSETSTPDEKNIYGQYKGYNGERLHNNNGQNKEKINSTDGKKSSVQFPHQNGDLLGKKTKVGDTENYKFVQELDRRIRDEEKGIGSHQFAVEGRKNTANKLEMQKTDGGQLGMDVAGFSSNVAVPNRINGATLPHLDNRRILKMQEKGSDDKQGDKQGDKRKYEGRDKQKQGKDKEMEKEKNMEKLKEKSELKKAEKANNKHIMKSDLVAEANNLSTHPLGNSFQGVGNEGNLKRRKDMEPNGVSYENELRPNKMARPISNTPPENGRKLGFSHSPGPGLLDKQGASHGAPQNSLKVGSKGGQRVNGTITSQPPSIPTKKPPFPAFNNIPSKHSPIKSPVITNHVAALSSSVPTTKRQLNHIAALPSAPKPPPSIPSPVASHHQPSSLLPPPPQLQPSTTSEQPMSRPKPPPAVVNKVAPPPLSIPKKKPPHPNTKYLPQILSVPKPDQWCSFDDQEWLFSSKARSTSKKLPVDELDVQVWSEAKHIESVDVCALPYVIPY